MKNNKTKIIGVIGLGYVGLPLAVEFAKKYKVFGYDININRVRELNNRIDNTLEVESKNLNQVLNDKLTIEGILLSMYDVRLRLSNQVVEEVQMHFKSLVFNTIIPRNVKLSEAPSFGVPVIYHDADCKGSISYINLAQELISKNKITVNSEG